METLPSRPVSPTLPLILAETLAASKLLRDVDAWWSELDADARTQLLQLWEECAISEGGTALEPRIEAYVADEWNSHTEGFWHNDFYEYIISHEDVGIYFERRYFIGCTQHPLAQAAIKSGFIPADLTCELGSEGCQMQHGLKDIALPPGSHGLRLRLVFRKMRR